jgi:hypothetical protein
MDIAWSSAWWPVIRVLFSGERGFAGETTGFRAANAGRCGPLVATDIDLDGHKEILVAVSDNLITLKGTGNGRFQVGATHFLGVYPRAIITAELDNDGCPDVAAVGASAGGECLAVLLNDGQGSLRTPVQYPTGEYAGDLASADFDLDGHADLAVTCSQTSAPTPRGPDVVMIFRNSGSGLFKAGPTLEGTRPASVVASDFNGDGYADLAVAELRGDGVAILLGGEKLMFAAPVHYAAGPYPADVIAADLSGDHRPDLVLIDQLNGALQILESAGDGTFLPVKEYPLPEAVYPRLAVADFTRDGKLDAAVICPTLIAPAAFEGAVSTVEILVNQTDYTPD